jgi:hypothetical protein
LQPEPDGQRDSLLSNCSPNDYNALLMPKTQDSFNRVSAGKQMSTKKSHRPTRLISCPFTAPVTSNRHNDRNNHDVNASWPDLPKQAVDKQEYANPGIPIARVSQRIDEPNGGHQGNCFRFPTKGFEFPFAERARRQLQRTAPFAGPVFGGMQQKSHTGRPQNLQ